MPQPNLVAEERTELGSTAAAAYRRAGKVPAVLLRPHEATRHLLLEARAVEQVLHPDLHVVRVTIGDEDLLALVKDVARDSLTDRIMHVDLLTVAEDSPVTVEVPIRPLTANCPGLKAGGMLENMLRRLRIKCAVRDIPEHLDVDLSGKVIGHTAFVADVAVPDDITVLNDPKTALITVISPRVKATTPTLGTAAEEEVEPEAAEGGTPAAEEAPAEEKAPTEG